MIDERRRQVVSEGWRDTHDDEHTSRELARAALSYVKQYVERSWLIEDDALNGLHDYQNDALPDTWPDNWNECWWKPKNPRRDLVRAAALIIAEIERLDRAAIRSLAREGGK